jgi:hypothetical protein
MKKVKKFKIGLKQIIIEVVTGLLTTVGLQLLTNSGILPSNIVTIVNILLVVLNILLIKAMWSWGLFYTVGWLIGSFVFFKTGLFGTWDFILYIVLPLAVIVIRAIMAVKRSLQISW